MPTRRAFGTQRKLPSGKVQVRYIGPDDQRYSAPHTFTTKTDASRYLAKVEAQISAGTWRMLWYE